VRTSPLLIVDFSSTTALVVSYTYYPNATTLYDLHFSQSPPDPASLIPERTLWSYIVQIASAIKKIHDIGHPVRMIDPTKILVSSDNRVRLGSCAILDLLLYPHHDPSSINPMSAALSHINNITLMQEDLTMFGRLLFCLSCAGDANAWTAPHFQNSLDSIARWYNPQLKSVCLWLISKPPTVRHPTASVKHIDQLLDMIRPKVMSEMQESMLRVLLLFSSLSTYPHLPSF